MKKIVLFVSIFMVVLICYALADIRSTLITFTNSITGSNQTGKSFVYDVTSTWIMDICTCSVLDTTTLLTVDLAPYQNFTMASYLLTSNNQSDKDSLLGSGKDTAYIQYEISPQNKTNDSGWISLQALTSYDTLLALQAGLPTIFPLVTATAYTPPMGGWLRVRAIVKRLRTAHIPDTLTLTSKHIFTPIDR